MEIKTRMIQQDKLTSECWSVQFVGLKACEKCEFRRTKECGGPRIRDTGKNSKGHKVSI